MAPLVLDTLVTEGGGPVDAPGRWLGRTKGEYPLRTVYLQSILTDRPGIGHDSPIPSGAGTAHALCCLPAAPDGRRHSRVNAAVDRDAVVPSSLLAGC